jgi:CheY-like chemotaxis protein
MVVDDDADTADSFGLLLRLWGHDARVCYRGAEALEVVDSYRPEAALLDLGMPGMDGWELARRLRRRPDEAKALLVAVTARATEADRQRAKAAGYDLLLVKPVDPEHLRRVFLALDQSRGLDHGPAGAPWRTARASGPVAGPPGGACPPGLDPLLLAATSLIDLAPAAGRPG